MIAKSVASDGRVTLMNFEFLLIGLLPFALAALARPSTAETVRALLQVWITALVAYVAMNSLGLFEEVRITTLAPLGIDTLFSHLASCTLISVSVGLLATLAVTSFGGLTWLLKKPLVCVQVFSASTILFMTLVFLVPV